MASSTENIKLGACDVSIGGVNLGLTKGGVDITIGTTTYKITVDQFGGTEVNEFITARTITVKVPLAETDLQKLALVMPGSLLVDDTANNKKKLLGKTGVGLSLIGASGKLVLHPRNVPSVDKSDDLTIPLATSKGEFSFAFKHDEERIYAVEFVGYADANGLLFILGDETAGNGNPSTGLISLGAWSDNALWNDTDTWKDS